MAVVRRNTRSHCFCRWVIHGDLPKHIPNIRCLKCTANDEVVLAIQLVSPYCWWLNPIFCCLVKPPIFMVESNMFWLKIPWKKQSSWFFLAFGNWSPHLSWISWHFSWISRGKLRRLPIAVPGQLGAKDDGKGHAGTQGLEAWAQTWWVHRI